MLRLLVLLWLSFVVGLIAWMYRPSPATATIRELNVKIAQAKQVEAADDWYAAKKAYEEAIQICPSTQNDCLLQLRLCRETARMECDELPAARTVLKNLLAEAEEAGSDPQTISDIRCTLAKASFDLALQLRLQGAHADLWREPARVALQQYQLLARNAMRVGDDQTEQHQINLERAVRLLRADQSLLAGMPFPPNCWSASNCEKKVLRERQRQNRRNHPKKKDDDYRAQTADANKQKANSQRGAVGW